MWTQRDQLQAYQFLRRRLVSALVNADANHPVAPNRRLVIGCAVGLAVALLVTAGFGIYGVLRPGANKDWRQPGRVVMEKETGAAYVLGKDGLLHPVLNYASARLLAGGDGITTSIVSRGSLSGVARGAPLGIVDAPNSLPPASRLLSGPWTVCASRAPDRPSNTAPDTIAIVGVSAAGTDVGPSDALLVRDTGNARYLITGGRRLRVTNDAVLVALGYQQLEAVAVSTAWINAIPAGPDLTLLDVSGAGRRGPQIGGQQTKVGQVLVAGNLGSPGQYYLVLSDGLAPLPQTAAALILGNPLNRAAYTDGGGPRAVNVAAAAIAELPLRESADGVPDGLPASVPRALSVSSPQVSVCAVVTGDQVAVRLYSAVPIPRGARPLPVRAQADGRLATAVYVPPGSAALVTERISGTAEAGTTYLVTDQGIRFAVPTDEARRALGYGTARAVAVSAPVLGLVPAGPTLDPAAAARVAGAR